MKIGDRIQAERKALGLTQGELGEKAGCKQQVISDLERGRNQGSKHIVDIARALRVSPEWLQTGVGPKSNHEAATTSRPDIMFGSRLRDSLRFGAVPDWQVARRIGITEEELWAAFESGNLDRALIPRFAQVCGVNLEWLLTGEGEHNAPNQLANADVDEIMERAMEIPLKSQLSLLARLADLVSKESTPTRQSPRPRGGGQRDEPVLDD